MSAGGLMMNRNRSNSRSAARCQRSTRTSRHRRRSDNAESATDTAAHLFDNWFDPIESGLRERGRALIEARICRELAAALARPRYGRAMKDDAGPVGVVGHVTAAARAV